MREILFRGKRLYNGEWAEGYYAAEPYTKNTYNCGYILENEKDLFAKRACIVDSRTVGQFTGLTDKNGKKIFEGDILKIYEGSEDDGYKIRKVYSYGGVLCVDYETSEWDFNALAFLDSDNVFTFEVIGNIYDNPELLEVTE